MVKQTHTMEYHSAVKEGTKIERNGTPWKNLKDIRPRKKKSNIKKPLYIFPCDSICITFPQ